MDEKKPIINFMYNIPKHVEIMFDRPLQGRSMGKDGNEFEWFMFTLKDLEENKGYVLFVNSNLKWGQCLNQYGRGDQVSICMKQKIHPSTGKPFNYYEIEKIGENKTFGGTGESQSTISNLPF